MTPTPLATIAWLGLGVAELVAYVALVVNDRPWWAVPLLVLFLLNRRPKAAKA